MSHFEKMSIVEEYIIYVSNQILNITGGTIDELNKIYFNEEVDELLDTFIKKEFSNKVWYLKWNKRNLIDFKELYLLLTRISNDELIQILNIRVSYNLKIYRFCKGVFTKIEIQVILYILFIILFYYTCYKIDMYIHSMFK